MRGWEQPLGQFPFLISKIKLGPQSEVKLFSLVPTEWTDAPEFEERQPG